MGTPVIGTLPLPSAIASHGQLYTQTCNSYLLATPSGATWNGSLVLLLNIGAKGSKWVSEAEKTTIVSLHIVFSSQEKMTGPWLSSLRTCSPHQDGVLSRRLLYSRAILPLISGLTCQAPSLQYHLRQYLSSSWICQHSRLLEYKEKPDRAFATTCLAYVHFFWKIDRK